MWAKRTAYRSPFLPEEVARRLRSATRKPARLRWPFERAVFVGTVDALRFSLRRDTRFLHHDPFLLQHRGEIVEEGAGSRIEVVSSLRGGVAAFVLLWVSIAGSMAFLLLIRPAADTPLVSIGAGLFLLLLGLALKGGLFPEDIRTRQSLCELLDADALPVSKES